MKFSTALCIAGSLFVAAIPAEAAERGWYLGAGVGQMTTEVEDLVFTDDFDTADFKESDTGFKVFGGYRFLPWLGVEGTYVDGGTPALEQQGTFEGIPYEASLGVEIDSVVAAVVFTLPLGDHFELFAKPGVGWWTSTTDERVEVPGYGSGSSKEDDSGTAFYLGVGAGVNFNEHFGLRAEYERFDVALTYDEDEDEFYDELDASAGLWSVSFVYSF